MQTIPAQSRSAAAGYCGGPGAKSVQGDIVPGRDAMSLIPAIT